MDECSIFAVKMADKKPKKFQLSKKLATKDIKMGENIAFALNARKPNMESSLRIPELKVVFLENSQETSQYIFGGQSSKN